MTAITCFRLPQREREMLEALRRRLAARSWAEVVRMALQRLAEAEGVTDEGNNRGDASEGR